MNILAVLPIFDQKIVVQMRVRLDAQPVPADPLKGLRHGIDARVRSRLHKKTAAPRPVHTIDNLVEFCMLRLPDQFLLVEGARSSAPETGAVEPPQRRKSTVASGWQSHATYATGFYAAAAIQCVVRGWLERSGWREARCRSALLVVLPFALGFAARLFARRAILAV